MCHLPRMLTGLTLIPILALPATEPDSGLPPRSRTFTVTYRATVRDLPAGAKALELWLPLPQTDRNQTIHRLSVDARDPRPEAPYPGRFESHFNHPTASRMGSETGS